MVLARIILVQDFGETVTLRLGIDTGGTYTDAVLMEHPDSAPASGTSASRVVAHAKSLTTRHDLSVGIEKAVAEVLASVDDSKIGLVALSTTLATNAVVEGYGAPCCLVLIGQPERVMERARLGTAVGTDPVVRIAGGHDAGGHEAQPLDVEALENIAREYGNRVSGFAVAGYFAVRNTAHELKARDILQAATDRPVTCSHQLSAALDAPRRTLTALFNARLVPLLTDLIKAVKSIMASHQLDVPLMVVQGDGSLVAAEVAISRPVETILSGPAASVIGAHALAGQSDAIVSDIGGTTTDVAVIRDGRPDVDASGATVGDWHTMVRAARVQTSGLGGDSEIGADHRGEMTLGPRRAIPLTILHSDAPQVGSTLKETLGRDQRFLDGAFGVRLRELDVDPDTLSSQELTLWRALENGAVDFDTLFADPRQERAFNRLRTRGLVAASTFTPTDAAHVLGLQDDFDVEVARDGAEVWARRLGFESGHDLARAVYQRVVRDSARAVVAAALNADGHNGFDDDDWFVERSLNPENKALVTPRLALGVPIVGIGAPAITYYPDAAKLLGAEAVVPEHAGVCNAVGAAVAGVLRRREILVTSPTDHHYRVHAPAELIEFDKMDAALEKAEQIARDAAHHDAQEAGAINIDIEVVREEKIARAPDGTVTFVECRIVAIAQGEPAVV